MPSQCMAWLTGSFVLPALARQLAVRAHSHWQTGGYREAPCPLHAPVPTMIVKVAVDGPIAQFWRASSVKSTLKLACTAA